MKADKLVGKKVVIVSDNNNYDRFRNKVLVCTHADNKGLGYDNGMYPENLCSFICEDGSDFPFSLYEYEFKIIN